MDISATIAPAQVVAGEIAGHEARQDAQRSAAFLRGGHDFLDVARLSRGEDLHQFRNDRAGQRSAGDDGGKLPPLRGVAAEDRESSAKKPRR